jgi:hypothetical protein
MNFTLGDCVFYKGEFWWTGGASRLHKISGDVATGSIVDVGPVHPALYGLAVVDCKVWGFQNLLAYTLSDVDASVSETFSIPSFGYGFVQGAAKRDEGVQASTFAVEIQSLACVPITVSSDQTVIITFTDPNFTHQVVILAGGSFIIGANYAAGNFVNAWLNN